MSIRLPMATPLPPFASSTSVLLRWQWEGSSWGKGRRGGATHRARLDHLLEGEVHPRVALDEVSVEGLAVLELDEHGVALSGVEQAEGQLAGARRVCQLGLPALGERGGRRGEVRTIVAVVVLRTVARRAWKAVRGVMGDDGGSVVGVAAALRTNGTGLSFGVGSFSVRPR